MPSMTTLAAKAQTFQDLHSPSHLDGAFIIPNPWDIGTARVLEHLGFCALATTSMGFAFSTGRPDTTVRREEMLEHVSVIASATELPVSADLESGYGRAPDVVAETVELAAQAGAVGGSIEDATAEPEQPIYDIGLAVDRVAAAAEAAHSLPFPFVLTARAENYLHGRPDLADTIKRLQAYEEAGADVLYAPGLATRQDIVEVVRSVDRPVNVVMGLRGMQLTLAELSGIGVRRVSVGSALYRAALGAFVRAAEEMRSAGSFSFAAEAISPADVTAVWESRT
jgi:2-methylisocitrate lyase-like PEP mutase family enzyme